jgi:ribosomal protein S18 acetylase RimI-like enzyme
MLTLISRPYVGATDLEPLIDLLILCRTIGGLDPWPPMREIRRHLATTPAVPEGTRLWEDRAGAVLAFASLWDAEILLYCMHPRAQSDDLLAQILAWGQARAKRHAERFGERATLCVALRDNDHRERNLLERQGFAPEAWSTLRMTRRLDSPIPDPAAPEGFSIRQLAGEAELAAVVALHQAVFTAPCAGDERLALMRDPGYCPDLDLVAVAPDGAFAGFCICSISAEEDQRPGHREGWVELLGTHPHFRRRGLAQALLHTALQRLMSHGVDTALLGTTIWNTPAQQLYTTSEFRAIYQVYWYIWEAEAQVQRLQLPLLRSQVSVV